jgi:hypothetical protein
MKRIVFVSLVALLLVVGLVVVVNHSQAAGEPRSGTVTGVSSGPIYAATALSSTAGTTYSSVKNVAMWNEVDVFVKATVATGKLLTVTVQFSPDNNLWSDAYHAEVMRASTTATTIITGTGSLIATTTSTVSDASTKVPYRVTFSAGSAQTDMVSLNAAGEYMRVKMEYNGIVTPSVWVTTRNN